MLGIVFICVIAMVINASVIIGYKLGYNKSTGMEAKVFRPEPIKLWPEKKRKLSKEEHIEQEKVNDFFD